MALRHSTDHALRPRPPLSSTVHVHVRGRTRPYELSTVHERTVCTGQFDPLGLFHTRAPAISPVRSALSVLMSLTPLHVLELRQSHPPKIPEAHIRSTCTPALALTPPTSEHEVCPPPFTCCADLLKSDLAFCPPRIHAAVGAPPGAADRILWRQWACSFYASATVGAAARV
eukprot:899993-Prymnesium_polylepis.1